MDRSRHSAIVELPSRMPRGVQPPVEAGLLSPPPTALGHHGVMSGVDPQEELREGRQRIRAKRNFWRLVILFVVIWDAHRHLGAHRRRLLLACLGDPRHGHRPRLHGVGHFLVGPMTCPRRRWTRDAQDAGPLGYLIYPFGDGGGRSQSSRLAACRSSPVGEAWRQLPLMRNNGVLQRCGQIQFIERA